MFKIENKLTGLKYTVYDVRYEVKNTYFLIYHQGEWKWVFADRYRPL